MPQLDPTWFASQLFWLVVCFSVLYLLLSKLVLPPLQNVISSRKGAIKSDLDAAQSLKLKAEEAKKSYEDTLKKSRETAQNLINEAEIDSKARSEEAIKALETQTSAQARSASLAISAKKQELLNELTPSTFEFASMIVEKLTQKTANSEQLKQAINIATSSSSQTQG